MGNSPWLPFRLASNEVRLAIHSLPVAFLPGDPEELFPSLADSILNSKNEQIPFARFFNRKPKSRAGQLATSVIVAIHPGDIPTMESSIRLFSRPRTIEPAYSSNRYTQCRTCGSFGHVASRCPSADLVCRSAPSTIPAQTTVAQTPPTLAVATLRLLLAVALPHHPAASTAVGITPPSSKAAQAARLLPLSGIQPRPQRAYIPRPFATQWTWPPMTRTHRPQFDPRACFSRLSRRKRHVPGERR